MNIDGTTVFIGTGFVLAILPFQNQGSGHKKSQLQ